MRKAEKSKLDKIEALIALSESIIEKIKKTPWFGRSKGGLEVRKYLTEELIKILPEGDLRHQELVAQVAEISPKVSQGVT